jgi:hypothetical protein
VHEDAIGAKLPTRRWARVVPIGASTKSATDAKKMSVRRSTVQVCAVLRWLMMHVSTRPGTSNVHCSVVVTVTPEVVVVYEYAVA